MTHITTEVCLFVCVCVCVGGGQGHTDRSILVLKFNILQRGSNGLFKKVKYDFPGGRGGGFKIF